MSDRIEVDDRVYPGQERVSANGQYQLAFQEDGNLVLYKRHDDGQDVLWASNTQTDNATNYSLILQADGLLVVYNAEGERLWTSDYYDGASSPYLLVQDDGNVCLYDNNVEGCHWNTATYQG